ncbi:MAG: cytochrome P450 [Symploca sp. SIO1C4]|uniref:Cytochrome P450 n=1 Tax=Symploca sp. SIO1C4 TaxID=2607765 RepID=A0A6B3N3Q1_9CYAN|nr:cytochrome P450 [Symploca sp. SIO1C4]
MRLPDGPQLPRWLQLIKWIADPFGYLNQCRQRYGDTFTLRLSGFEPLVFLSHPQAIQAIFTASPSQFDSGRGNGLIQPLLGDNSLVLLDGNRHRQQRKLLLPPFHGERMYSYCQLICELTEEVASRWVVDKPFVARNAMQEITLRVIMGAVFGLREGERYQQLKPMLGQMLDMTGSPLRSSMLFFKFIQQDLGAWSPWGKMLRRKQKINELLQAEIEERRKQDKSNGNDILTLMISVRDENGEPMTDQELKDQLMTLLFAGHETTATALSWALYWIHQLPDVRKKLLQELDGLGNKPDPMTISKLPYLSAICQETLRIYPVAPVTSPRIAKSPIKIMGRQYDTNTILFPCIYLTHHREELYQQASQFKPERFIERQYSAYEYLPFGGGNRLCIGYALAMLEMKLVLATILSRYQLALVDDKPVKPTRRGVTLAPANGIPMVLKGQRLLQSQPQQPLVGSA